MADQRTRSGISPETDRSHRAAHRIFYHGDFEDAVFQAVEKMQALTDWARYVLMNRGN